jgi:hypothetical protein
MPAPRKTASDKASHLKHDPISEFRSAPMIIDDAAAPTLLAMPSTAVKGAMRTAALDLPGASKTQIGRLTYINGMALCLYGLPKIYTTIVRSADMNRTPDVRTRAILPRWAMLVDVTFVRPILRETSVANLLAAAGITVGIGDYRPEKGAGNHGQFKLVSPDDPEFLSVVASGGRAAQEAAMASPEAYDSETEELLAWFNVEVRRRGFKVAA